MNSVTSGGDEAVRFDRACQWFIDLREQPQSPDLVAQWLEWCRADARNRQAFERAREVWQTTAGVPADVFDLALAPGKINASRRPRRKFAVPLALAASLLAAAILLHQFMPQLFDRPQAAMLSTGAGENRTITLADGSTVALGAASRLATHFDERARRLTLESGEAYFRVEPDRARPFVVNVGELRVTALGTAFNVRTASGRVIVSVSEGVVAVDPPDGSGKQLRAGVGEEIAIDTATRQVQVGHVQPDTVASWQSGRLEFTREPLRAVLASVNRYSARAVRLEDPRLGELRFTGTVFADRVDDWLRALPEIFPVNVREDGGAVAISGIAD